MDRTTCRKPTLLPSRSVPSAARNLWWATGATLSPGCEMCGISAQEPVGQGSSAGRIVCVLGEGMTTPVERHERAGRSRSSQGREPDAKSAPCGGDGRPRCREPAEGWPTSQEARSYSGPISPAIAQLEERLASPSARRPPSGDAGRRGGLVFHQCRQVARSLVLKELAAGRPFQVRGVVKPFQVPASVGLRNRAESSGPEASSQGPRPNRLNRPRQAEQR